MRNINRTIHDPVLMNHIEGKLAKLLPPGWGMETTELTRGFSKAFDCFGGAFIPMHTTTQQIKIQIYHEKHKR